MAEPSITDVFGTGASAGYGGLVVPVESFSAVGLTLTDTTHAESIVVALALMFSNVLTETNRATDLTNRNVTCTYAGQDVINQSSIQFRRDVWSIVAYKESAIATVVPGDY